MNDQIEIRIAKDFSEAPGARDRADGPKSGQEFLEELLRPKFMDARDSGRKLLIDFDGVWGYASSFVSGSFGALAREFGSAAVRDVLVLKSDEDQLLIEKVFREIDGPVR